MPRMQPNSRINSVAGTRRRRSSNSPARLAKIGCASAWPTMTKNERRISFGRRRRTRECIWSGWTDCFGSLLHTQRSGPEQVDQNPDGKRVDPQHIGSTVNAEPHTEPRTQIEANASMNDARAAAYATSNRQPGAHVSVKPILKSRSHDDWNLGSKQNLCPPVPTGFPQPKRKSGKRAPYENYDSKQVEDSREGPLPRCLNKRFHNQ